MRQKTLSFLVIFLFLCASAVYADDNIGLITDGVARTLFSVFEIPKEILANSTNAFPLGLVAGTISGAMKTIGGTVQGAGEIARGAAPYAKYAALAFV